MSFDQKLQQFKEGQQLEEQLPIYLMTSCQALMGWQLEKGIMQNEGR